MIAKPLGYAGSCHQSAGTRHGWSKALQLAPDLYPGVGGKRFRAALLQRAFKFAGGRGPSPVAVAEAVEMLHAGSLVLDDFEDDSATRRQQPALHRVIGPARAVNAGNWMYFRALELAGSAYEDPARTAGLLMKFVEVARQCHEGQAIDLSTRIDEITPHQARATALAISRWKTGRLVSLAAWSGAHAANGEATTLLAAAAFGCRVGICLQIKNDLDELTAFVDGEDRCDDLLNRRVTWPWALAAEELSASRFRLLQERIRRESSPGPALRRLATSLLEASRDRGVAAIDERLDRAVSRLAAAGPDAKAARTLAEVADALRSTYQSGVSEPGFAGARA
ncbi:polyprenyl synthetase family protein [Botrimarina sp.]|uniref:polyprenyl synthetase family protein n=1 Tax=Botrimarina sp. TaxID=2795802 RepID=UPI0032EDB061